MTYILYQTQARDNEFNDSTDPEHDLFAPCPVRNLGRHMIFIHTTVLIVNKPIKGGESKYTLQNK